MSIAVLSRPPLRRLQPGVRRALTVSASFFMHLVVLGGMVHLAKTERAAIPPLPSPPTVIQLEIQRPPLSPLPQPPLPAPTPLPLPTPDITPERELMPVEAAPPRMAPVPTPAPASPTVLTPAQKSTPQLDPRPMPQVTPAPLPVPAQTPAPPAAALERAPAAPAVIAPIRPRKKDEDEGRDGPPSAPAPRLANPAPGSPAASASGVAGVSDAWRVAPEGQAGRNARALRTSPAGCPATQLLRRGEELICEERFNTRAAEGAERRRITGTGDADRDARFAREGAREMQRYEAQRRPLGGGVGVAGPQDCPGSNFGTGCAGAHLDSSMQMGSGQNVQTRRDGPAASGRPMTPGVAGPREPMKPQ